MTSLTFEDRWFYDLISSLLIAKWMSESKSAPQGTLEGSRTRKTSAMFIDLIWPQLTSVDLRRTGWPVECISTTWYYMSTFISLARTAMIANFCATERILRLTRPQLWRHRSDVREVRIMKFSGGDVKKIGGKLSKKWWHSTGKLDILEKPHGGTASAPCAGEG